MYNDLQVLRNEIEGQTMKLTYKIHLVDNIYEEVNAH